MRFSGGQFKFIVTKCPDVQVKQGLTPKQAIEFIATQGWSEAAQKGANIKIISTSGSDGKMSMPIMAGIGMGIGQDAADDENKRTYKNKDEQDKKRKSRYSR